MALATVAAIRNRCIQLVEWVDPVSLVGDRLRRYRNEGSGDFRAWAEKNTAGCFRRFQVRDVGHDEPPQVSNMDYEERRLTLETLVAYPQTHRYGADNALDRDDVIAEDWDEIDFNIGLCSRANFSDTYDCTPLGATKDIERSVGVDYLVIRAEYLFKRALSIGGFAQGVGG